MKQYLKKEIAFERVLFFSDAVVAIAITLLALNLHIDTPDNMPLTFADLVRPWEKYVAFVLSFITIAGLWRTHHDFFIYIKKMDDRLMYMNIAWLFFIVTLPFATSLLSSHFGEVPAVFLYSINIFALSMCQNFIWDYSDARADFIDDESISDTFRKNIRRMLNLDMLNGLVAVVCSFYFPKIAFFLLYFKLPLLIVGAFYMAKKKREVRQSQ